MNKTGKSVPLWSQGLRKTLTQKTSGHVRQYHLGICSWDQAGWLEGCVCSRQEGERFLRGHDMAGVDQKKKRPVRGGGIDREQGEPLPSANSATCPGVALRKAWSRTPACPAIFPTSHL